MAVQEERQGYLGNLTNKTKPELVDLLRRQEKLLSNRKLIQSMPDKGKKVEIFIERLQTLIKNTEEVDHAAGLFESLRIRQNVHCEVLDSDDDDDNGDDDSVLKYMAKHSCKDKSIITEEPTTVSCLNTENDEKEEEMYTKQNCSQLKIEKDSTNVDSGKFLKYEVQEGTGNEKGTVNIGDNQENIISENAYVQCLMKIDNPSCGVGSKKKQFQPHRTLKHHSVKELEKDSCKIKTDPSGAQTGLLVFRDEKTETQMETDEEKVKRSQMFYESAATPPKPIHNAARSITVEESLMLQRKYKQKQEEIQTQHATEKLLERLNMTMEGTHTFDTQNMRYRENLDDIDSDDDDDDNKEKDYSA